jgi:nucleotide-binding universal stress UspA family protein
MFKRILCPIECDRLSVPTLEFARRLAEQAKAKIYLLYVVDMLGPVPPETWPEVKEVAQRSMHSIAHKWLEGRVSSEVVIRTGDAAAEVVRAEEDLDVDLVVMATHGRTGEDYLHLGSVTERVVRNSTRPVLTLRPR